MRPVTTPQSNGEDSRPQPLVEFNQCHTPSGPAGGQFCATAAGGRPATPQATRRAYGKAVMTATGGDRVRSSFAKPTTLGKEIQALIATNTPLGRVFARAKQRVLERAETPEEREHASFIARMEVETALSLMRGGDSKWQNTVATPAGRVYSDERLKLHKTILDLPDVTNPNAKPVPVGQQPTAVFMGGLAASGKTSAVGDLENGVFGLSAVRISNDLIKTKIPGYRGHNAHEYHEESSDLAEVQFGLAIKARQNLIYDFTFKTESTMEARMLKLKAQGYRIEVRYTDTDVNTSVPSAILRATREEKKFRSGESKIGGRYIPLEHIRNSLRIVNGQRTSQNRQTFERLKKYYDAYMIVDNNGLLNFLRKTGKDSKAKLIERVGRLTEASAWWRRGRPGITIFPA